MRDDWFGFVSVSPVFEAANTFDHKQGSTMRAWLNGTPDFVFGLGADGDEAIDELIAFVLSFLFWRIGHDEFATRWAEFNGAQCFLMWRWARCIPKCRVLKATIGVSNREAILAGWESVAIKKA